MTKNKGFLTAYLKVRPFKSARRRFFQQRLKPPRDDKNKGLVGGAKAPDASISARVTCMLPTSHLQCIV
jgi:hypothetical protein